MCEKYTGANLHLIQSMFEVDMKYYSTVLRCLYTIYDIQISNQFRRPYLCRLQCFSYTPYRAITINVNPPNRNALKDFEFSVCSFYFLKLNKTDCLYRNWSCRQYSFCLYINGYKNRDRATELDSYLTPK